MNEDKKHYEAPQTEALDLALARSFVQTIAAKKTNYESEEW